MLIDATLHGVMQRVDAILDSELQHRGEHQASVTPELFLLASADSSLFQSAFKASGGKLDEFRDLLKEVVSSGDMTTEPVKMSNELDAAMQVSSVIAQAHRRAGISFVDVVYVLISQSDDIAYYFTESEVEIPQFVKELYRKAGMNIPVIERVRAVPGGISEGMASAMTAEDAQPDGGSYIERFTVNMLEQAKTREEPLVGRDKEIDVTIRILCRKEKANPLHVGEAGVGKTAIVLGLAKRILEGRVPDKLKGYEIYSLDTGALVAGSRFRGDTEERVKGLLNELSEKEKVILYIDEVHTLIGTGAAGNSGMDLGELFKTALVSSNIRFIGTTTYDEYRQYFEKDKALSRRFKKVDIVEPTPAETKKILKGIVPYYEKFHGVTYDEGAIDYAISLTVRYINDKFLPDKAIDIIDEAGAYFSKDNKKGVVTSQVIEKLVSETCRVPVETVSQDDSKKLLALAANIKKKVFGQDEAIDECVKAIKLARSGLQDDNKPVASMLFVGQTGVGKTEIAKQLASHMGIDLIRFDMSEYSDQTSVNKLIGASSGYVGYEDGGLLVEEVRKHPNAVLLLDEIEKAHPQVFNVLLQVMDNAELTDNKGRKADFKNIILIMTSNAGASGVVSKGMGFNAAMKVIDMGNMRREVDKTFTPEFRNRLTKIITLNSMNEQMAMNIVTQRMRDFTKLMKGKGVKLTYGKTVLEYLKTKGITEEYGARELLRVMNNDIKMLFVDGLLVGTIGDGSVIRIRIKDEKPELVVE